VALRGRVPKAEEMEEREKIRYKKRYKTLI
jgi:hypothetical protein